MIHHGGVRGRPELSSHEETQRPDDRAAAGFVPATDILTGVRSTSLRRYAMGTPLAAAAEAISDPDIFRAAKLVMDQ